jgi:hypothetical protein
MEIATEYNMKEAVKISLYHDTGLRILSILYPSLLPLYNRYHPLHVALMDGFSNLDSSGAIKQGDRVSVEEVLASAKIDLTDIWLPAILTLHTKTSARYKQILPKGMTPFNNYGVDARITAYNTLSKNIGVEAALSVIKGYVVTTYELLLATRAQQSGAKTNTSSTSDTLELLRIAAMDMQYRNLGFIMDNFFDTKETICSLVFDLTTIRSSKQVLFTGKLAAAAIKDALAHTFLATDTISVKMLKNGKLYLSNTIGGTTGKAILIVENIKTIVNIADFGVTDYANFRYLTVENQATVPSNYSVTLL